MPVGLHLTSSSLQSRSSPAHTNSRYLATPTNTSSLHTNSSAYEIVFTCRPPSKQCPAAHLVAYLQTLSIGDFQVAPIATINSLIGNTDSLQQRCAARSQLLALGLDKVIESMRQFFDANPKSFLELHVLLDTFDAQEQDDQLLVW